MHLFQIEFGHYFIIFRVKIAIFCVFFRILWYNMKGSGIVSFLLVRITGS